MSASRTLHFAWWAPFSAAGGRLEANARARSSLLPVDITSWRPNTFDRLACAPGLERGGEVGAPVRVEGGGGLPPSGSLTLRKEAFRLRSGSPGPGGAAPTSERCASLVVDRELLSAPEKLLLTTSDTFV